MFRQSSLSPRPFNRLGEPPSLRFGISGRSTSLDLVFTFESPSPRNRRRPPVLFLSINQADCATPPLHAMSAPLVSFGLGAMSSRFASASSVECSQSSSLLPAKSPGVIPFSYSTPSTPSCAASLLHHPTSSSRPPTRKYPRHHVF